MPHFLASDGTLIHYTDEGSGTPLICLSSLMGNGEEFDFVAPHLSHMHLIRPDYRGRGRSGHADPRSYTVLTEAQDILELMDYLGLEKAAVLGNSRGGLLAMSLAAVARPRLLGVALNDIGPEMDVPELTRMCEFIGQTLPYKSYETLAQVWPHIVTGFPNLPQTHILARIKNLYKEGEHGLEPRHDPALRTPVLQALSYPLPDLWPFFDALQDLPLCALRGENSNVLSLDTFQHMQERRPDMITAHIPDRGHIPYLDEPEARRALTHWTTALCIST